MTPLFILSTTIPQIINSTPKIKLNLNIIKPIVNKIGIVKDKLYVTRIIKEIIPRIEQNLKPFFIIIFVNLSKLLKLFKILLIICITHVNDNILKYQYQWK